MFKSVFLYVCQKIQIKYITTIKKVKCVVNSPLMGTEIRFFKQKSTLNKPYIQNTVSK